MISFKKGSIGFDEFLFSVEEVEFARGAVHVLMGRNGIGKSAFLNTISGMINPIKGSLDLDGKALYQYAPKELSTKISYVSSSPSGVPFLRMPLIIKRYWRQSRFLRLSTFLRNSRMS